ncbi:MAG: phosphoethanolamine transferase [Rickettsiales bacterium]|jgi:glucan phosphoethanolaminetransferase (alkaline phosphatase superfamily)|nr:phosphoethanolamine transferase [Rickettsiales bacterium]
MKFKEKIGNIKERILANKFYLWSMLGVLTFLCFMAPGLLYSVIKEDYTVKVEYGFLALFIPMALFLAVAKTAIVYIVLVLIILMEMIQFGHIVYFGIPLNPFVIETILSEMAEITESGIGIISKIWYFPFLILLPYGLLIVLYKKTSKNRKQYHTATIFLILLLAYFPRRVLRKESAINNMMPMDTRISLYNSFRSFSGFFFNRLPKLISKKEPVSKEEYIEYVVEKDDINAPINVIVVMGESVNYAQMSLFGYERDTTPLLKQMSQEDKNFVYKEAISSGVTTLISTSMFFNIRREPDNVKHSLSRKADMFKLAKNNGFTTTYFSAQAENLMTSLSSNHVDEVVTKEDMANKLEKHGEIYLVDYFKENKQKLLKSNKNFLVIHQRNIHSPYKHNYKSQHEKFSRYNSSNGSKDSYMIDTYDNAMLYNDYFLFELLNVIRQETEGTPTYLFFVSDHGEAMGKNGKFGHAFLAEEVAEIPFFATLYWAEDNDFKKEIENLFYPTHYEIGKIIAKRLGYKIINPNEEENVFFINGPNIFGTAGYISVTKDSANNKVEFK